ncbi:MAG: MFS transporter [bacterium]
MGDRVSMQSMIDPWKRTVRILFVVHLLTAMAFSLVIPFLPFYVRQLGVKTSGEVAFWSGVIFAVPAITMMVSSPLWGWLADRHGRKLMLVRSTVAGMVILALMGFAQNVQQLVLLRALQGALSGYIAASNALVAATIPRERAGESFGFLRTGNWVGTGLGPLLGGVLGEIFGYRQSFWITSGLLFGAAMLVIFGIQENFVAQQKQKHRGFLAAYRVILTTVGLPRIFTMRFFDSLGRAMIMPILPLFMAFLMGGTKGVATATGLLFGLRALAGSAASIWVGRLGDHIGHGKVVSIAALGMAALYLPQPYVTAPWQLVTLQVLTGVVSVGVIPGIGALLSLYLPEGSSGASFGLESSVDALARTVGPVMGGVIVAGLGYRSLFHIVVAAFLGVALLAVPLYHLVGPRSDGNIPA